jgi:LPS-assembly protein
LKAVSTTNTPEQQIRIFHAPSLDFVSADHRIGSSSFQWSAESSIAGLKRVQPNFTTTGLTWRYDLHPELALPLSLGNWHIRPSIGMRETVATRSRQTPYTSFIPKESESAVNRADFEAGVDLRPPVFERTFSSNFVHKLFGSDVMHTIEPAASYRYVTGVDNFLNLLRFDDVDVVSNTNELQYGGVQRLFLRHRNSDKSCSTKKSEDEQSEDELRAGSLTSAFDLGGQEQQAPATADCNSRELISWRITQKYFFDPRFGGAIILNRRNIFQTTLNLSGIAFLTEPRNISPLISRLRLKPSNSFDLEWDFDLDTGARKFTANNVFVDFHQGNIFSGLSYARLNAPGRFYTAGFSSLVSDFNQLRFLLGYGSPTKPGLGVAANIGLDLAAITSTRSIGLVQYAAVQASYNFDCCGFSVEYRKYELGSVRNENAYRFNITLANIGTAGNLRRAERLF